MSGTSVDGIDAAIADITGTECDLQVELIDAATYPYPEALRKQILAICAGEAISMAELAELDDAIAREFAQAALTLLGDRRKADLIGSHGQTLYHRPPTADAPLGYSLQLGRGEAIARLTGIPTVSNFRAADIAAGGQGAPLVPKVDFCLLTHPQQTRCVQNIGGIGNVTYLPPRHPQGGSDGEKIPTPASAIASTQWPRAWDTGPGNALLDLAVQHLSQGQLSYDADGAWASTGKPCETLVQQWLSHPFFQEPPPKSTGRELFGKAYLQQCLADAEALQLRDADILATIAELTVAAIARSYRDFLPQPPDEVLLCGGGSRNGYLRRRLQLRLSETFAAPVAVLTTSEVGLNADFKEAIAWAVLAYWRYQGIPGNLPHCTGAKVPMLLGDIHRWMG